MPAWISALSPETILVVIAATGGVVALLLVIAAVRRMRAWELRRGSVYLLGAAVVAALSVGGAMLAASLHTYARLTHEQEAARAVLRALGPQRYELLLVRAGEPAQRFELRGDEWQIDARVLKWRGMGTLLGFDTVYRFARLQGRYANNDPERKGTRGGGKGGGGPRRWRSPCARGARAAGPGPATRARRRRARPGRSPTGRG